MLLFIIRKSFTLLLNINIFSSEKKKLLLYESLSNLVYFSNVFLKYIRNKKECSFLSSYRNVLYKIVCDLSILFPYLNTGKGNLISMTRKRSFCALVLDVDHGFRIFHGQATNILLFALLS